MDLMRKAKQDGHIVLFDTVDEAIGVLRCNELA